MYASRYPLLKKAYDRFRKNEPEDFAVFCKDEAEWLDEYALFMALKTQTAVLHGLNGKKT